MNFCWATIRVTDMEKSLKFYHEMLGLPIDDRHKGSQDSEICMLGDPDKPKIELICRGKDPVAPSEDMTIGINVDSLDDAMELAESNGFPIISGPISPGPSIRFCFLRDPDGYRVQFSERIK